MKRFVALLLAYVIALGSFTASAQVPIYTRWSNYNPAAVAITGGNLEFVWEESFVPVGIGPTGTMGNNGAVTWGTALPRAYTGGAFVWLPAGAIATSTPAAATALWYVGTDTTHGTFFNVAQSASLDANGAPVIPTSPAAFATTGPGAFTGLTTSQTLVSLTIPASTISTTGYFDIEANYSFNNNANNKLVTGTFGGSNLWAANEASAGNCVASSLVANQGSASIQVARGFINTLSAINGGSYAELAINTGSNVTLAMLGQHSVAATDVAFLDGFRVKAKK
jgi:hypothetical protein